MAVEILTGDCREVLKTLPDESVHCVVTSPPYFGLRDYGTAKWEGGEPGCDHVDPAGPINAPSASSTLTTNNGQGPLPGDKYQADRKAQFRQTCGKCGAPWVREVEKSLVNTEGWGKATKDHHEAVQGSDAIARNGQGRAGDSVTKTLGFSPSCSCGGDTIAGTVLDPFSGAGTTGLVARNLGRSALLIELNPEYAAMAEQRIPGPLFAWPAEEVRA